MFSTRKRVSAKVRAAVYERDGHACVLCGDTRAIHIHHVIPRSHGGSNEEENLVCLCPYCHRIIHGEVTANDFPFDADTATDACVGYLEGAYPGAG